MATEKDLQDKKIEEFLLKIRNSPDSATLTGKQLLDRIKSEGIISNPSDLAGLEETYELSNRENEAFKSSVLSRIVYTPFDKALEYINAEKRKGKSPSPADIMNSGTLNKDMSPMDLASLAYYSKSFTPVNVMPEGQFEVTHMSSYDNKKPITQLNMSYKNGVYRADSNIAMAMTVMSVGADGKPELNVTFRGTDVASKNQMVEPDGTVIDKSNKMAAYVVKTYLDMAEHNKVAFAPFLNAVKKSVQAHDQNDELGNTERLTVKAGGHSLGAAMAEEWVKQNSRTSYFHDERQIKEGIEGWIGAQSMSNRELKEQIKQRKEDVIQEEVAKPIGEGEVNLKAVVFGAPSNNRKGWAAKITQDVSAFKARVAYDSIQNKGLSENWNPVFKYPTQLALGAFNTVKNTAILATGLVKFIFQNKEESLEIAIGKARDRKILERDFEVYNKPLDPVAKAMVKLNLAEQAPNLHVIEPVSQNDKTFKDATATINEHETEFKKGWFSKSAQALGKIVKTCLNKLTLGVMEGYDIGQHDMKRYSASVLLLDSPLRHEEPDLKKLREFSPMEKLQTLLEVKSKKDIFAMEVIMKDMNMETTIRNYQKHKDFKESALSLKDFDASTGVFRHTSIDMDAINLTFRLQALKNEFGNSLDFTTKPTISNHVTAPLEQCVKQDFANNGLPENIKEYKGHITASQKKQALDEYAENKKAFERGFTFDPFNQPTQTVYSRVLDKETGLFEDQKKKDTLPKVSIEPGEFSIPEIPKQIFIGSSETSPQLLNMKINKQLIAENHAQEDVVTLNKKKTI